MKRCPNCGCSLSDNTFSCPQCGSTISKKSPNNGNSVKNEFLERAEKGKKELKLLLIPAFIFLIWIASIILGVVSTGGLEVLFILLAVFLIIAFFVSTIPINTKMKRENTIARVNFDYLKKQGKLDLLDTITNDHIVMTNPMVFSNGKIISCPSQGIALPIDNIERIEGIDNDGSSRKIVNLILFGFFFAGIFEKAAGVSYYGVKIFTKDKRCFCIELDKHELAQVLKKNPGVLPGNIRMIDIF